MIGRSVLLDENIMKAPLIGMGIMLMLMGNMLPKTHGIKDPVKTKWNSANDVICLRVNRLTGRLIFISGLITTIATFVFGIVISIIIMTTLVIITVVVATICSEKIYKKYNK